MLEVADVFRRYGPQYVERFGDAMPTSQRRAMDDLTACRTKALGGHVFRCAECGEDHYEYHSCRNSACPKCNGNRRAAWLDRRRSEMLPVPYFHLVFTLPRPLGRLARGHQRVVFRVLFRAATQALQRLALDPRYLGARIGVLAILHTWTRSLVYHPHVHCLVPAGGLSPDGERWLDAHPRFLVPVRALSRLFRARFQRLLRRTDLYADVDPAVWSLPWVVHCKPTLPQGERVLRYLGRYVHRVAIANSRLVSMDDGRVTFRQPVRAAGESPLVGLDACEFIRRFLQHVLPERFVKVRYGGFWSPALRRQLRKVKTLLASRVSPEPPPPTPNEPLDPQRPTRRCRHCGSTHVMLYVRELQRGRVPTFSENRRAGVPTTGQIRPP